MRILALETSGTTGSAALLEDEKLVAERAFDGKMRTAQSFTLAIDALIRDAGWTPQEVKLVAVSQGPGSFTGLRIGVTAAKTFAYSVGGDAVGVNSLEVIAVRSLTSAETVSAVMNAGRGQLYSARFCRSKAEGLIPETVQEARIVDAGTWLDSIGSGETVTGPALKRLRDRMPPEVSIAPEDVWEPTAALVGQLGYARFQSGQRDDFWRLVPLYYRQSAAEEKLSKGSPG